MFTPYWTCVKSKNKVTQQAFTKHVLCAKDWEKREKMLLSLLRRTFHSIKKDNMYIGNYILEKFKINMKQFREGGRDQERL